MEFLILLTIILFITVIIKNNKVKELNNEKTKQEEKNKQLTAKIKQDEIEIKNVKLENESLNKKIDSNHSIIDNLKSKIDELVKELSFYTEIKKDSLNLNVEDESTIDTEESVSAGESLSIDVTDLNEEKTEIYNLMENTNSNLFITGKAGTGKSYLLKYFRTKTKKRVLYTAPTGIAALNISGTTLHSAFGFNNLSENNPIRLSQNQRELFKNIDTLIIDEISMVRSDVFNRIDLILQYANNNSESFGGKQIILLGDLFQLPPVAKMEEAAFLTDKYGGLFFFNYSGYNDGEFIFKELNEVFRQNDKDFISILNNIREGNITKDDITLLNEHYTTAIPRRVMQIVPTKNEASNINIEKLNDIKGKEYIYNANILVGESKLKETDFPCDFTLKLKVGALVMMIVNDQEHKRWVNGTLGIISELTNNMIKVTINGTNYEISRTTFNKYKCEYNRDEKKIEYLVETSVNQFPLILAYAITIHKSQGMTYQQIAVNIENCFAPGQAYVALSRCANFDKLYLTRKINPSCIITDNGVVNFYNRIKGKIGVV